MRNRLIMGAFRYGLLRYKQSGSYDMVRYLRIKLEEYEKTGNAELLPDIANMALLEYTAPSHLNFHWKALDDQEVHCPKIEKK